ncbi:unnamed protein product [Protopolystoma xenopodis]|uniref:Meiosis expressed gene 1 protein homolog n=1 Tax=Protopolystoma xenopodis TaxID=117903 RepID=A0A3S4ZL48_9PLAT|nr:unnamed protein product [Protopolystoma xenopodis]
MEARHSEMSVIYMPKGMNRAYKWNEEVEDAYRFQLAGYRDEVEYKHFNDNLFVERWPDSGFVKKLKRKDGFFYYYNRKRECEDKDVHKCKLYIY